jgi:endonuclease YncB( thermonuclease family)
MHLSYRKGIHAGLIAVAAAALSLAITSPALAAKRGPCVAGQKGGPKCLIWKAKTKWTLDGDTIRPYVFERGKWSKRLVRITGIQAMELKDYSRRSRSGECLAVEAAKVMDRYVHAGIFRLVSLHRTVGGGSRARLRRSLQVKKGGKWVDPAMTLLKRGLVLWSPDNDEWAWNGVYGRLAEQAQRKGKGLWNPEACGHPGPSSESPLTMKVKWDGDGTDTANSEWVRIKNAGTVPVSLRGWRLRDPDLIGSKMKTGYNFPADAVVPAGGSVTVRVGKGSDRNGTYFWGLPDTLFQNATNDRTQMGDGAYLFDPDDEVRAYVQYPCRTACPDEPLAGNIALEARYMGTTYEWVTLSNRSNAPISLDEYEVESVPWFYEFGPRDVLGPREELVLFANKQPNMVPVSKNSANNLVPVVAGSNPFQKVTVFHDWGHTDALFGDNSDIVTLRNPLGAPVICEAWGGEKCPEI